MAGLTPLHLACWGGHKDVVDILLLLGADPVILGAGTTVQYISIIRDSHLVYQGRDCQLISLNDHKTFLRTKLCPLGSLRWARGGSEGLEEARL